MPQILQETGTPAPTEVGFWVNLPSLGGMLKFEFEGPLPSWFPEAVESLDRLSRLPKNWDSYGAEPIRHSSIFAAIQLLLGLSAKTPPALPSFRPIIRPSFLNGIRMASISKSRSRDWVVSTCHSRIRRKTPNGKAKSPTIWGDSPDTSRGCRVDEREW